MRNFKPDSVLMENTDIDMVITIPDTPDRVVRHSRISREVRGRPQSREAPVRYKREENRDNSDTQNENGLLQRSSGNNALFRTAVEKDKGKSICIDPCAARVEKHLVVNLDQHNGHAHVTASRCLPSEDIRNLRTSNGCSPLQGDHVSSKCPVNKGKGYIGCGSVSNRETIDLSSDKKPNRGTKRLVRHGCISPQGIAARARQAADTNSTDTVSGEQGVASATTSSIGIREIVSENDIHGRDRGKIPANFHSRVVTRDASEGWVSTHNRTLNIDLEMNRRDESDSLNSVRRLDVQEIGADDREGRQKRRRKNGFSPLRASNEPEVYVIGSFGEPSSSRPQRFQRHHRQGTQVLEIEDSSPEVRVFRRPRLSENNESDMQARQIEADEILARELQEQLYQEATLIRNEPIDETIARLLEQEENSLRVNSTRNTRSSNTIAANRGGRSRLEARLQQNSIRRRLSPSPIRASVVVPPAGRGPSLLRPRASLERIQNLSFPNGVGLNVRLNFLQMDRDFTEDDYEMLLALDENNHGHGGASTHGINNLPESIVQTDKFQENCVICLETPTIGDTIRHLPCFHKFHKDCIDPWLGRSKLCPVCKCSVA